MKIIRSGDKNFEEEKAKMFRPLDKEEQLRRVFKHLLSALILEVESGKDKIKLTEEYTNILLKEVSIRVYIKK